MTMKTHAIKNVDVEYCPKCYGLWLGPEDVEKITKNRFLSHYVNNALGDSKGTDISCPSCNKDMRIQMVKDVEIDTCPECKGTWFDYGEIEKIDQLESNELVEDADPIIRRHLQVIRDLFPD